MSSDTPTVMEATVIGSRTKDLDIGSQSVVTQFGHTSAAPNSPASIGKWRGTDWSPRSSISTSSSQASPRDLLLNEETPVSGYRAIVTIGLAILFWYITSVSMTFVNKYLFDTLGFDYQILVTFLHFAFMSFLLRMGFANLSCFPQMPHITLLKYFKFIVPISFFSAVDIALGNEAYSLVGISVMTVIKSSIVVFTYLLSVCCGLERFRWRLFFLVGLIVASISLTVPNMVVENYLGVVFLCLSVLSAALRWVIIHHQLQQEQLTSLQLMMLTQPLAAIFLAVPAIAIDVQRLIEYIVYDFDAPKVFTAVILISISIFLALLLILSEYHLVGLTSSLSLCVAGVGKELVTIIFAIFAFQEIVTPQVWVGIGFSVIGIILYSHVRYSAMQSMGIVGFDEDRRSKSKRDVVIYVDGEAEM